MLSICLDRQAHHCAFWDHRLHFRCRKPLVLRWCQASKFTCNIFTCLHLVVILHPSIFLRYCVVYSLLKISAPKFVLHLNLQTLKDECHQKSPRNENATHSKVSAQKLPPLKPNLNLWLQQDMEKRKTIPAKKGHFLTGARKGQPPFTLSWWWRTKQLQYLHA